MGHLRCRTLARTISHFYHGLELHLLWCTQSSNKTWIYLCNDTWMLPRGVTHSTWIFPFFPHNTQLLVIFLFLQGYGDLISTAIVWPFFLYSSVVTSRSWSIGWGPAQNNLWFSWRRWAGKWVMVLYIIALPSFACQCLTSGGDLPYVGEMCVCPKNANRKFWLFA